MKILGKASNNAPNVGFKEGTDAIICVGNSTTPKIIPTTAVTIIPIKIAAGVLRTNKINVTTNPITVINTFGSVKSPIPTNVASLLTMIPEFWNPKKAMKNPIPVPKVTKNEAGARLLLEPDKIYDIVANVVDVVKKPVTVKMRTGWDKEHIYAIENALKIEQAGASAIAVHGRTRSQMYEGKADWGIIKDVKDAIKTIPVIGNGDINSPEMAKRVLEESGVDGIMIGRAALGNPWLMKKIVHYLATDELIEEPSAHEKLRLAVDHMDRLIDLKCEKVALLEMRSHMAWYIKGLEGATHVKRMITTVKTREEMMDIVNRYEAYLNGDKSARLVVEE